MLCRCQPCKLSFHIAGQKRSELRLSLHLPALFALPDDNTSLLLEYDWFVFKAGDHINDRPWEELNMFLEQLLDVLVDLVHSH